MSDKTLTQLTQIANGDIGDAVLCYAAYGGVSHKMTAAQLRTEYMDDYYLMKTPLAAVDDNSMVTVQSGQLSDAGVSFNTSTKTMSWNTGNLTLKHGVADNATEVHIKGNGSSYAGNLKVYNAADSAFTLVGGGTLTLGAGTSVNEFSIDGALTGNSDDAVPTEKAVKTYVDAIVVGGSFDKLQLNTSYTPPSEPEGQLWWNSADKTVNVSTGTGPVLQLGHETQVVVHNATGGQLLNGTVVYKNGVVGGRISVAKANATTHVKISSELFVLTETIDDGNTGQATTFGNVRGLDTSSWSVGDRLWIGTTDGLLTNSRPAFPDYAMHMGEVLVDDASTGEIRIHACGSPEDTVINFWNGCFRETFDFRITSNGTVITGAFEPSNGHDDMTMLFSDGMTMLDTSPALTIALTAGTAANPQTNYVYIPKSTKVLTKSTSGFPTTEHIKVAQVAVQTAAIVETEGALRNQNINDAIENTASLQGHLSHITERIRQMHSQWDNGIEATTNLTGGAYIKTTAGQCYQMHLQSFPQQDMTQYTIDAVSTGSKTFTISGDGDLTSVFPDGHKMSIHGSTGNDGYYTVVSTAYGAPNFVITVSETIASAVADGTIGDDIHVVNHNSAAYTEVTDLEDITTDASGGSLNNNSFSVVVWGTCNKTNEPAHLMLNLPLDTYNNATNALRDTRNYTVYDIPKQFQGVGFLIAKLTFSVSGGTWSLDQIDDLRGFTPNTASGGGLGGGGVDSFLALTDTPSAYTAQANKLVHVNAAANALEFSDMTVGLADGIITRTGDVSIRAAGANILTGYTNGSERYRFADAWAGIFATTNIGDEVLTVGGGLNLSDDLDMQAVGDAHLKMNINAGATKFARIKFGVGTSEGLAMISWSNATHELTLSNNIASGPILFTTLTSSGFFGFDASQISTEKLGVGGEIYINSAGGAIQSNAYGLGVGVAPTANMLGVAIETGLLTLKETTTPTADTDYGKIYFKSDNKMYCQTGDGVEHEIAFV